jgi:hypothetical protein
LKDVVGRAPPPVMHLLAVIEVPYGVDAEKQGGSIARRVDLGSSLEVWHAIFGTAHPGLRRGERETEEEAIPKVSKRA